MHFKVILATLLGIWLCVASPATAQAPAPDADQIAAAQELIANSGVADQFDQIMPLLMRKISQSFEAMRPERAGEIRSVMDEGVKRFVARKQQLIEEIVMIYARTLSLDDLKDIAAFYKTPAGAHFRQAMPSIMSQSMIAGQRWGTQIGSEIEREMRQELKKRGIDL